MQINFNKIDIDKKMNSEPLLPNQKSGIMSIIGVDKNIDSEPLIVNSKVTERDDINGMLINMGSKIDVRSIFIIWVAFIFLHTEMFFEYFLCRFKNSVEDGSPTMMGTMYSSVLMIMVVVLVLLVF
jgi:hypothetical protein